MLSELQHFCLDAMGLSHGLAPKKITVTHAPIIEEQLSTPYTQKPEAKHSESNTLQRIKKVMPKVEIPDSIVKPQEPLNKGIAPKDLATLNDWSTLQTAVSQCQYCQELSNSRSQTIFGMGNEQADLMIISEAPSSDEDIQGHPFVGKAGTLLDNMLLAIGINRDNTYITNIIKCQPPNNRDPHKNESQACEAFLNAQINHIKPKLILALGRIAAHNLLDVKTPVGQLRGTLHQHSESQTDLIISYHPAYLLRNPTQKPKSWEDLKNVYNQKLAFIPTLGLKVFLKIVLKLATFVF